MIDLRRIVAAREPLTLASCPPGVQPWLLADLARAVFDASGARVLFVAPEEAAARAVADAAPFFAPELETVTLTAWDCLPYDRASPSLRSSSERLAALSRLVTRPDRPALVVATVNGMLQRTLPPERLRSLARRLEPGTRIERDELARLLTANGYQRCDTVVEAGEYAVRGGLLDLFPAGGSEALRLDFFGDDIETIRRFDPATQRTVGTSDALDLRPVSEVLLTDGTIRQFRQGYLERFGATATADPLYQAVSDGRRLAGMEHWLPLFEPELATVFDYLAPDDLVVRDAGVTGAAEERQASIADYFENRRKSLSASPGSYRPLEPQMLYLSPDEWRERLVGVRAHLTSPFPADEAAAGTVNVDAAPARDFAPERAAQANVYEAVRAHVDLLHKGRAGVVLASYSAGARERLRGLLEDHGLTKVQAADSWQEALGAIAGGRVALVVLGLEHGFTRDRVALLTEQDMLGDRLVRRRRARKADTFLAELALLTPGDLLVHADHGIGRYEGLTAIEVGRAPHDCVWLTYDGGDKLYIPVENIDVLSRYGSESEGVALDRLGGAQWQARKARMKERIQEIAGELLSTAAKRAMLAAPPAVPDPAAYSAFVDRFPYAETDDQQKAVDDVLSDLATGRPMDRLVCGDVGFGKTEVALRAAFAVAMEGEQVAVVCPTTLLARQHFQTFRDRFAGLPVEVAHLSRLVPANEAKQVRTGLAEGQVDIVVGTHALLSRSVSFKRLGLVIVDEEQRFGVAHKERLKALKTDVHVLTLTATPIPRTLQMAMSGLRELSLVATPPVDRLAVRTYVMPWDAVVIREALLREHYRGGQSFFVTPRVADLGELEQFLREQVPEVKTVAAHGQMAASEVEERMSAFYEGKYDVLLSTTIVESGLDIPTANTLIVHRADMFGLAQLYQLRGRVGRSKTRAYAYMTTPADRSITEAADKRLQVLSSLDSLGAGFQLASHDLDIRGAGNLLGDEQSGHIREIGFELYQQMLEEAIVAAKAGAEGVAPPEERFSPQINVDVPILIPETYVPDLNLRMSLYRRLNEFEDGEEVNAFAAELIDRFGPLPEEALNLVQVIETKLHCRRACVARLDVGPKGALVSFQHDHFPNVHGLIAYIQRLGGTAKLRPDQKLVVARDWGAPAAQLKGAQQLARSLAKIAGGHVPSVEGEERAPSAPARSAKPGPAAEAHEVRRPGPAGPRPALPQPGKSASGKSASGKSALGIPPTVKPVAGAAKPAQAAAKTRPFQSPTKRSRSPLAKGGAHRKP